MTCRRVPLRVMAAGCVALLACACPATAQSQMPPPTVTVAQPVSKRITNWDEFSGHFEAVEAVEVRARVSGFVDTVHFKDGQIVSAGDLLFTIEKRPFQIALESAEAEVARTQAQVAVTEADVERSRPLVTSGTLTEREFDQRNANLKVARAQLQAAEASVKTAALNLEWTEVRAPISGRISDRKVDAGNLVTGGSSDTTLLTTIVSLDPIHFVFDGSEADYLHYSRLRMSGERPSSRDVANPVKVKLSDEAGWVHEGHMDFVDNQFNSRSGTIRARAILDNKDQLLAPGMFGRLRLFGGDFDSLLIPDSAILSDQMRKIVLAAGPDGTLVAKTVTLGPIVDGLRVVKSGLAADDRIVIDGLANPMVRPGVKASPEPGEIKSAQN